MEVFGGIPNKNLINIVNTDRKFEYFKAVPRNKKSYTYCNTDRRFDNSKILGHLCTKNTFI